MRICSMGLVSPHLAGAVDRVESRALSQPPPLSALCRWPLGACLWDYVRWSLQTLHSVPLLFPHVQTVG